MYYNGIREYKNEKYTEFICLDQNPMKNEYFMKNVYSHFNEEPRGLRNNNLKSYNALKLYTGCGSRYINSLLHSNEELIKNNQDIWFWCKDY